MGQFTNQPDFGVRAKNIQPTDDINPSTFLRKAALYIGTGDDITVLMQNPDTGLPEYVTFVAVPSGTFMPICVDYVLETGTKASNIVAYW